jgi:hypothetical protein
MASENSRHPESDLDEAPAPPATDFNENSRFVQAWADEECIYDDEEYQRIEDALPCDPSVDKTQFRPKFRKMAIALIADSLKRVETVDNSAARKELVEIGKWLDWALMRLDGKKFPLSAAGQRLAQAARDSAAPWQEIPVLLASVRKLRDYCEAAVDGIEYRDRPKSAATTTAQEDQTLENEYRILTLDLVSPFAEWRLPQEPTAAAAGARAISECVIHI